MISCNPTPDGSGWPDCAKAQPDPDIAGIGVIASFVITAAITLAASIAGYLLRPPSDIAHLPSLDPRQHIGSLTCSSVVRDEQSKEEPAVAVFCARNRQREERRRMWSNILDQVVLSLSDQQLATCFAILAAALIRSCQISLYHLNTVCDLAWFATITHLLSITVLRHYWLQDSKKVALYVRSVLIISALFMLLCVVAILLASYVNLSCLAICIFLEPAVPYGISPLTTFEIVVDICIVFWAYPTTCLFVFPLWYKYYRFVMWKLPSRIFAWAGRLGASAKIATSSPVWFNKGTQVVADTYQGIFFPSTKFVITCQVLLWCLRLFVIIQDPLGAPDAVTDPEAELVWGFGQLLAVIIIFLPFLTLLETWSDYSRSAKAEQEISGKNPINVANHATAMEETIRLLKEPVIVREEAENAIKKAKEEAEEEARVPS